MTEAEGRDRPLPPDPILAAWLVAIDPFGLGGVVVRGRAGPGRDRWLTALREVLAPNTSVRRLPMGADEHRLFGGLDLTATLVAGRPIEQRGLLADADGGVLLLAMAERLSGTLAARLGAILDSGVLMLDRDGLTSRRSARFGLVAFDEGFEDEERPPAALRDRLGFEVTLDEAPMGPPPADGASTVRDARLAYPGVRCDDDLLRALCETAAAVGADSSRALLLALRAARATAALAGRSAVEPSDAAVAARLVLAPRATRLPIDPDAPPDQPPEDQARAETPPGSGDSQPSETRETEPGPGRGEPLGDVVLSAATAAIPPGLLAQLTSAAARTGRQTPGRAGVRTASTKRGRPAGCRAGAPGDVARLNILATLRAAAPWQRLRQRPTTQDPAGGRRIEVRRDDLRVTRFKQRGETTTIFVVDASGSLAINRLAEAKGAVELLLADCYVRRDQVALLAFRGKTADLLLPPTRSLARAKRCLAELPGGGATPLAGAIDAALSLAEQVRRRGQTPVIVFLTDGRANVARDGTTGRAQAEEDARQAAQAAGASGVRMLVIDASPRPQPPAKALAATLQARYVAMPRADAGGLSLAVRAAAA